MTAYESLLQQAVIFFLSGMILRSLAVGHWTEWTQPVQNFFLRLSLAKVAWIMLLYAALMMLSMLVPPGWALFFIGTALLAKLATGWRV